MTLERPSPLILEFGIGWHASSGNVAQEVYSKLTVHELPPGDKPYLPCLIVNTGSNHLIMLVSYRGNKVIGDVTFSYNENMVLLDLSFLLEIDSDNQI